ncbi:phage shock protein A [Paenibacillus sp. KS1]|uniref:PspA/IM30 family protein n=1 Tax=Paenibacillus sp. KS1 TaxID=1849249 RepID=UPI00080645A0|nr:PspA/IM30 family protein [Paenibacillus sp. KS1]OBY77431.1 phage shock protein A [Paenibacillus sp. KS1]
MEILSRVKELMSININSLFQKSEDPEKIIDDYMRMLSSDLGKVKAETASVVAAEQRAKRALDECEAEIAKLQRYAEKSAADGNEAGARTFLEKKAVQSEKLEQLQTAYDMAASNASQMKQLQDKLVSDIGELEARRAALKGKLAAAQAQERLNASSSIHGDKAASAFDAMEDKVNRAYDEAMALAELRGEKKDDLDELIEQLKKEKN